MAIASRLLPLFLAILVGASPPRDSVQKPEPYIAYDYPQTLPDMQTMVQLFQWKWTDIAKECEDFLQYYGYGAVQISPPQEHIILEQPKGNIPWWIVYQPVSYKLVSRGGTRLEFQDMVERCNEVGVRIVVDAVLNHMVGVGQIYGKDGRTSSAGSYFYGTEGKEDFPGVPYHASDTHSDVCNHNITDYQNTRICRLSGLIDLDQHSPYVQGKMIGYLNKMIDMGVAGFRFDASKHMDPKDLHTIIHSLHNLREDIFGKNQRPFCAQEMSDEYVEKGDKEQYLAEKIGRYADSSYRRQLLLSIYSRGPDFGDLQWWGQGFTELDLDSTHVLAFIDNHDIERNSENKVLTYKDSEMYVLAVGFMLAWNYGYPRVMSSYYFDYSDQGPPHLPNSLYQIKSPEFDPISKTCTKQSGWVCEHRWQPIRGMALFRQNVMNSTTTIQHAYGQRLAFSRDGKGFFAGNNDNSQWNAYWDTGKIQTNLPAGEYCDAWSGEVGNSGRCTGRTITVDNEGRTNIKILARQFVAIHVGARISTYRSRLPRSADSARATSQQ